MPEGSRTNLPRPVNVDRTQLQARISQVRDRLATAEERSGRPTGSVTLIAVIKTLPSETIAAAVQLGLTDLGENRVQEAELHQQAVARGAATWHMIGHLQRNKAGKALSLFDLVHGVDNLELAGALARRATELGRRAKVLIEVNVSGEASKFGTIPDELPALLEQVMTLESLEVQGLMTVGAPVETSELARPGFVRLRKLRDSVERRLGVSLPVLSMGMSGDYEVAVEEGATMVRVGTAIFGSRQP